MGLSRMVGVANFCCRDCFIFLLFLDYRALAVHAPLKKKKKKKYTRTAFVIHSIQYHVNFTFFV